MISRSPPLSMLGAASALSPFGMAVVVPTLVSVGERYAAEASQVQFIVSAYLLGLSIAQPLTGFLCDRLGRRPVMLFGFALFVLASFLCVAAQGLNQLIFLRFVQAAGVSVGTVASRAIIRDTRDSEGTAEAMSYIAAAMGIAPVIAPILGGWLGERGGFQFVFAATGIMGAAVLAWLALRLPETLHHTATPAGWRQSVANYPALFRSRVFMGYTLIYGFVQGSFFAFLAVGAAIFETSFGIGPQQFGLLWGGMAVAYVCGATLGGHLTRRFGSRRIMKTNVLLALLSGWWLLASIKLFGVTLAGLTIPMAVMMATSGAVIPGAMAGAVNHRPDIAGTSSGLSSSLGILLGGLFTVASGLVYDGQVLPIAGLMALSTTLTAISWILVRRLQDQRTAPQH